MKLQLLVLLTLSLFITACGKTDSKKPTFKEMEPIAPELMDQVINQQNIYCAEPEHCPSGIGRMFSMSRDAARKSMSCTAILIGPDLVLTNSHCAYTGRSNLINTCASLYFSFPGHFAAPQSAKCAEILWRDKRQIGQDHYKLGDNDFALIRLNKTLSITPIKLAKGGMSKGTMVYPTVVDQIDGHQARIVGLKCEVKHLSEKYGVATLSNCPIIAGNSGSAVLDENQNLIGLIFASSDVHVRTPEDEISVRKVGNSTGFAYVTEHMERHLGKLLN